MHRYHFPRSFLLDIAACALATALVAAFAFGTFGLDFGSAEEGPLETVQEWFLVVSFAFLMAAAWAQPSGAARFASVSGAALAAVFFLRELEPVGAGPVATYFQSDAFRLHETVVIALLAVALVPSAIRSGGEVARWLVGRSSWPLFLAGFLILAAELIDGRHVLFGVEWLPRAIEETFETLAYAVLLACSLRWYSIAKATAGPR